VAQTAGAWCKHCGEHGAALMTIQATQHNQQEATMGFIQCLRAAVAAVLFALASHAAYAAGDATPAQRAFEEANKAAVKGPSDVKLADQAVLHLPAGHVFIPNPQANQLLNAMGNPGKDARLQGLVFPSGDKGEKNDGWFMVVRYEAAGYVKDDDARDWKADELLASYREGTEASNEERRKMGVPEIEITGWAEKPAYDAAKHRLVWAMTSRDKGAPATATAAEQGVNYNTYALGREGYFTMNLVTGLAELPAHKGAASTMLAALDYQAGKRYEDFNSSTDRVAEYGLAALVVGVAGKKLGLFAVALAFLAKFAKVILLGVAGFGAVAAKFFKRKPKE
jgi:uncharacterized membrane-anchored protein